MDILEESKIKENEAMSTKNVANLPEIVRTEYSNLVSFS